MSSTNKTANLKLHSWVRTDPVVCEDFNDNFTKLDEAVGGLRVTRGNCEIYAGTYTGTGTQTHSLTFPKRPLYITIQLETANDTTAAGFVIDGTTFFRHQLNSHWNKIYISGTTVTFQESEKTNATLNMAGEKYHYMAFAAAG